MSQTAVVCHGIANRNSTLVMVAEMNLTDELRRTASVVWRNCILMHCSQEEQLMRQIPSLCCQAHATKMLWRRSLNGRPLFLFRTTSFLSTCRKLKNLPFRFGLPRATLLFRSNNRAEHPFQLRNAHAIRSAAKLTRLRLD